MKDIPALQGYTINTPAKSMYLRDYFAAKAMQCLCSEVLEESDKSVESTLADIALTSYAMAEAMLKVRDEK